MEQEFKYYAFISYNSRDTEWGKRVQKKLEGYKMPATLCSQHGWKRKPISPVFFAPTDIQPGGLTEELQERLRASRNLIVICSPNSAKSEWVGKEIAFFHSLGRTKQIHFFIVDGVPHSGNEDTECFNPIVDTLGLPEILGANIHEKIYRWPWLNKERAYVQLVSKLLGVEFDAIWQRHRRQLIQQAIGWTVGIIAVICALVGVWMTNQPVDIEVRLRETSVQNEQLPPLQDAVVTLSFANESKTDTIPALDVATVFKNIPHRFLGQEVGIAVHCRNYLSLDTTLILTQQVVIDLKRDPEVYGHVRFRLWSAGAEQPVAHATLQVDGREVTTDDSGIAELTIPLDEQKPVYAVTMPGTNVTDSLHMPCGADDAIVTE